MPNKETRSRKAVFTAFAILENCSEAGCSTVNAVYKSLKLVAENKTDKPQTPAQNPPINKFPVLRKGSKLMPIRRLRLLWAAVALLTCSKEGSEEEIDGIICSGTPLKNLESKIVLFYQIVFD